MLAESDDGGAEVGANEASGPWSPRRLLFTSAGAGFVAFVGGSLLYATLLGAGPRGAFAWGLLLPPAIWTALLTVVALVAPRIPAFAATGVALLLAPVASVLTSAWEDGAALFLGDAVTTSILVGRAIGFTGAAAVGVALARGFARGVDRRVWFRAASLVALLIAVVAAFALPLQFLSTYFSLGGGTHEASSEESARYVLTVAVGATAAVAAIACAVVAHRRSLTWCAAVILALVLCVAGALPVPQDRFRQAPAPEPSWTYVPCYGEGAGCEGG